MLRAGAIGMLSGEVSSRRLLRAYRRPFAFQLNLSKGMSWSVAFCADSSIAPLSSRAFGVDRPLP
jgi:hypothetical protein